MSDVLNRLVIRRALPVGFVDGDVDGRPMRGGRYGEAYGLNLFPGKHVLADEGSYFVAANPTPGTAIQQQGQVTAFADTTGQFVIGNLSVKGSANAKRIYLDFIREILAGTAPTGTLGRHIAIRVGDTNREPTTAANRTLLTPYNVNGDDATASVARVMSYANAGAMTIPASTGADRLVARAVIPTGLGVVHDEYLWNFGPAVNPDGAGGSTAARATDPARRVAHLAPIIIGPGQWAAIHIWWVTSATTVPSWEFELGWVER